MARIPGFPAALRALAEDLHTAETVRGRSLFAFVEEEE
jgi:hypothetical protein